MRIIFSYTLLFLVYGVAFVLPAILLPVSATMNAPGAGTSWRFFVILIFNFTFLIYLINRLNARGITLCLHIILIIWGLQTFMTQIETWYFREAMANLDYHELINLFIRPLLTACLFVPIAVGVIGKWKSLKPEKKDIHTPWPLKSICLLALGYVLIYFVFGYFVAWQFEAIRVFYTGSAVKVDFFESLMNTATTDPGLYMFQILRGALYALLGTFLSHHLGGSKAEKLIFTTLLYALLPSILLIIDNPFMPAEVRLAHFIELTSSNGLFGLLIGLQSENKPELIPAGTPSD